MKNNLLLIFTRNPELGKCKTRLAAKVGDRAALDIYKFLLDRTVSFTCDLEMEKWVYYSETIWENDIWSKEHYQKKLQKGTDLGQRMLKAFQEGFDNGFEKIIIIGSDMYDLSQREMEDAFLQLDNHDFVIGPAMDGGYYLLGMKSIKKELFQNKSWGTNTVLSDTLKNLKNEKTSLLQEKNDVDHYEDIKDIEAFQPFLKHLKE
ncbi:MULTISPECIES: TIGR04282 family arsenosugar biosynthesis glycosyltransferase [Flavobacteriaceae]|uniref:TIGR04282 family arsenosugar biosynthesis glycosyltransferase n=1 Tax=Flavobacteriaceae TaxID=49546 RepID=UPI001490F1A3|nr:MULTISPECIES: TIGR04282 family arsenosugar biosynthesis glycosyltransferase [Allomuricauda]MDC6365551.1 TIGR04282 family arsenosugar biosynthesis glycosyltransferase [Muricauda sp. AC10]